MTRPLLALLFAATAGPAAEPAPKLVPRPIPGLPVAQPVETPTDVLMSAFATPKPASRSSPAPAAAAPLPTSSPPVSAPIANEPARILFVHRRDRLPAAMRQRLKALPVEPAPKSPPSPPTTQGMLEERAGAIRIIPKSEVPLLKPPPDLAAPPES